MNLKNNSGKNKILFAIKTVIAICVIVLSALGLFDVWDKSIIIIEPLLGVMMLLQAFETFKSGNKLLAFLSLGTAVFVFAVSIVIFFF